MRKLALALSLLFTCTVISSSDSQVSDLQNSRFELFYECSGINLELYLDLEIRNDKMVDDLTERDLVIAVESRLRSARIFDQRSPATLLIFVKTFDDAFSISAMFEKPMTDVITGLRSGASRWFYNITGKSEYDPVYILDSVDIVADEFLVKYLRVNDPSC